MPRKSSKTTRRWPEGAIVYQIYPRSFFDSNADGIGDLPGITQKLSHLSSLGVNAVWLSPFYPSPMADFGYDVADYCGVDPIFGNLHDMKTLITKAHEHDIKVMVDLVPNHSSDEHPWFNQSKQSASDPYSDWYIWRDPKGHTKSGKPIAPNNWIEVLTGGPAWQWEPLRQQFYLHSFDVKQPDLNWSNPEVREAIKSAMRFWLDHGVDGFRVDAVQFMAKDPLMEDEDENPDWRPGHGRYGRLVHTKNHGWPAMYAYLSEMASVLQEPAYKKRNAFMVTEAYPDSDNHVDEYLSFYEGIDAEVAAPFIFEGLNLPWQAADWRQFLKQFHGALDNFSPHCVASYAFGNHDQHRIVSRLGEDAARSAAVLLLTLPGMAFIYNGEELGMPNGDIPSDYVQDPGAQGGMGRDPERTPLPWNDGVNGGFSTSDKTWLPLAEGYEQHNVATEAKDSTSFLSLYRTLGKLRNKSEALRYGSIEVANVSHQAVLRYSRRSGDEAYTVLVNFTSKPSTVSDKKLKGKFVVSSHPDSKLKGTLSEEIRLLPHEAIVIDTSAA